MELKILRRKRVLISGATGFIGANLVRKCLEAEAKVHIITRTTSNKWRIGDVLKDVNEFCVDLLDYERLKAVVSKIKADIIFHTATYGGYPYQKDVDNIIQTNIIGTVNLLNACLKVGFNIFVNTGSSSEYGVKSKPANEVDLLEPNNNYGVVKASATLFCQSKARSEKLPIITLRLFSPYGYYEEATRFVPSVIISCLREKNPKVSSPEPVRDFVFIGDVLDAYVKAANIPSIGGEIFNIGYSQQHSVGEVVNKIIELTGGRVSPEWGCIPKRANEPTVWQADISKAKNIFKWKPKHILEEGLNKTVKWFEENLFLYKEVINQEFKL